MREDFLHYVWRHGRFDLRELTTTEGETIDIQQIGRHNTDAGPDFSAARIRIGGIQWAGPVEIHPYSHEWYEHGHQDDPAYQNVILHVVLEESQPVYRHNGQRIPCLELKRRIPAGLIHSYWRLMHNEHWIPCQYQLQSVPADIRATWLELLLDQRLARRAKEMQGRLENSQRDWESLFYQSLARSLGGRVNADAMDMLARAVPLRLILRHQHSLLQVEALLFGQANLIPEDCTDEYAILLRREYQLLATKYDLRPLPAAVWRYLRLRPANFPTLRIAQLARFMTTGGQAFSKILVAANPRELQEMFTVELSNYWRNHYRFGKQVERSKRRLGTQTIQSILINTVVPMLELYGQLRDKELPRTKARSILRELPPEDNSILRQWAKLGWRADSAAASQSLLELQRQYCYPKRCLDCSIGAAILDRKDTPPPRLTINESARLYSQGFRIAV